MKKYVFLKQNGDGPNAISISVDYQKGLGFYLLLSEGTYKKEGDYVTFSIDVYGGKKYKEVLESCRRYSDKKMNRYSEMYENKPDEFFINLLYK